jgi:hypothetical protein
MESQKQSALDNMLKRYGEERMETCFSKWQSGKKNARIFPQ